MPDRVRVATYLRVSTKDQVVEGQRADLKRYIEAHGWEHAGEYADIGVSGARQSRPQLDALMRDAQKRRFDVVLVWRFDRFARSTKHLLTALDWFRSKNIRFISDQENIDTGSPLGEAIFTIVGAVSQLERDIIRERIQMGLRRARAMQIPLGRPLAPKPPEETVLQLRSQGLSIRAIAAALKVPKTRIASVLKESSKASSSVRQPSQ